MNAPVAEHEMSLSRKIGYSFLSAFCGWFLLNLIVVTQAFSFRNPGSSFPWWFLYDYFLIISAIFVFASWLIALLPLYCFLPPQHYLWRWPVATIIGFLFGGIVMFFAWIMKRDLSIEVIVYGAMTGGVSAYIASRIRRWCQNKKKLTERST